MKFNIGTLDIEQDVTKTKIVNLITFINGDGSSYTAIHKQFLKDDTIDDIKKSLEKEKNKFKNSLNDAAIKAWNKIEFKFNFECFDSELKMIEWIFSKVHFHKPDFLSIWNMRYDIGTLLDRVKFRGGDTQQIMCHPDVPDRYKVCDLKLDNRVHAHHTFKWDWFSLSGFTQCVDSMCLYSLSRKAKGVESGYGLDVVCRKRLGAGKLDMMNGRTHYEMQYNHFVEYTVYNIFDNILLLLLDHVLNDVSTLLLLTPTGSIVRL